MADRLDVLTGMLELSDGRKLGLRTEGSTKVLRRRTGAAPRVSILDLVVEEIKQVTPSAEVDPLAI